MRHEVLNHNKKDVEVVVDETGTRQCSSKSARLLGIIVDTNLNFHAHINQLVKDVEYRLWLFRKVAKVADRIQVQWPIKMECIRIRSD